MSLRKLLDRAMGLGPICLILSGGQVPADLLISSPNYTQKMSFLPYSVSCLDFSLLLDALPSDPSMSTIR
jgi:hypothetical protein